MHVYQKSHVNPLSRPGSLPAQLRLLDAHNQLIELIFEYTIDIFTRCSVYPALAFAPPCPGAGSRARPQGALFGQHSRATRRGKGYPLYSKYPQKRCEIAEHLGNGGIYQYLTRSALNSVQSLEGVPMSLSIEYWFSKPVASLMLKPCMDRYAVSSVWFHR